VTPAPGRRNLELPAARYTRTEDLTQTGSRPEARHHRPLTLRQYESLQFIQPTAPQRLQTTPEAEPPARPTPNPEPLILFVFIRVHSCSFVANSPSIFPG
jgi:hypothetical protein